MIFLLIERNSNRVYVFRVNVSSYVSGISPVFFAGNVAEILDESLEPDISKQRKDNHDKTVVVESAGKVAMHDTRQCSCHTAAGTIRTQSIFDEADRVSGIESGSGDVDECKQADGIQSPLHKYEEYRPFHQKLLLFDQRIAVLVFVGTGGDHNKVDKRPDAAATKSQELDDTNYRVSCVKTVNSQAAEKNTKQECRQPVFALSINGTTAPDGFQFHTAMGANLCSLVGFRATVLAEIFSAFWRNPA